MITDTIEIHCDPRPRVASMAMFDMYDLVKPAEPEPAPEPRPLCKRCAKGDHAGWHTELGCLEQPHRGGFVCGCMVVRSSR